MNNNYGERIARVETKLEGVDASVKEIKETLRKLPDDLVAKLDERYAARKDVEDIQETISPLTSLRKRLWAVYVGAVLSAGTLITIAYEHIKRTWGQ